MRLNISQLSVNHHKDVVTAAAWSPSGELFTCSDDNTLCRWSIDGENLGEVCRLDAPVTDMDWFPSIGTVVSDIFAISCTDGTLRLMSKTGREEKKVVASATAAIVSLRWNHDGSTIATAGEDGAVKVWSRSGQLRSTIATCAQPVYTVVWGPDQDKILYSSGREITVKSMQVDRKQLHWKAHDGVVMSVDWNVVNNFIVSSGEDCKYKVWDSFGRQLFQSSPFEFVVTSVRWAPSGDYFAAGSFDMIRLCDKTGWSYGRERPDSGSLFSLSWTSDGTQVAGAGGNGAVVFGRVVGTQVSWKNFEVTLTEPRHIRVSDVFNETTEELDFRDRVVEMAVGYGHCVVATPTQCYLYNVNNWNTPHIFDLRSVVNLIIMSERHFVMVDNVTGIQVYSYDGRVLCAPKFAGMRVEVLSKHTVAVGPDCIAIVDKADGKTVRVFEVRTGRPVGKPYVHEGEVTRISLSQFSPGLPARFLAVIDSNNDLHITPVLDHKPVKLQSMVDSCAWNDVSDMLVACADGNLMTWQFPAAVYVDRDLLAHTRTSEPSPSFGKLPQIQTFFGTRVAVRRGDGALLFASVDTYPPMLYEFVQKKQWDEAIRLCRFVNSPTLWGVLAGMSIQSNNLDTAEVSLAALNEIDKLHYILHIKDIPHAAARNAELALYKRNPEEAEKILLQQSPPLVYRAIKMNITLFRWHRALELATQFGQHLDTVLGYRQRHLAAMSRTETDKAFISLASTTVVDWDTIKSKKAAEKRAMAAAGSSGGGGRSARAPAPAPAPSYSEPVYDEDRFAGGGHYGAEGKDDDDQGDMDFKEEELSD